eukprot:Em0015g260a
MVGSFRMLTSVVSIIAVLTVILPAVVQKKLSNPNVHPLMVLSLCDCLLSLLWLVGSGVLLTPSRGNSSTCITLSTLTVIFQCITINMTVAYSFIAYFHARQAGTNIVTHNPCSYYCVGYMTACFLPFALVLVPFGVVISDGLLVQESLSHVCGCFPDFSNLLPHLDNRTYIVGRYQVSVTFAAILIVHYLVAFPLLCALYCKVLQLFKVARRAQRLKQRAYSLSTDGFIAEGERKAQKMVTAFLLMFIVSRAFNLVLAVMAVVSGAYGIHFISVPVSVKDLQKTLLIIQSITTPLQGCLNAVVYGWTRGTFRHLILSQPHERSGFSLLNNGEKDAVALVRLVASSLSIIGSAAIVLLVITKRKACNTKIQPILVLSLADCLLAVMWIIGSMVWMKAPQGALGNWCIWILVFTVVFELVTVNVTLVYALTGNYSENIKVWHPFKTAIAYGFAWFEPFFVVLLMLGLFDSGTRIVQEAKECSCWCVPFYGNVVPIPPVSMNLTHARGSAIPTTILLFLTLFVVTGAANFILSLWSVGVNVDLSNPHPRHPKPILVLLLLQSLVLPLQGFLNAIVYGWTNEDFVDTVIKSSSSDSGTSVSSQRGRPSYLHRDQSTSELVDSEDVASEHH